MLEIGFANGASLALWANAFPKAEIIGIDIRPIAHPHPDLHLHKNINQIIANAYSKGTLDKLDGKFDVIINDGPHSIESQIKCLALYPSLLAKGGVLVIEDVAKGLRAARLIRNSCPRRLRSKLVYYDFRDRSNHFDNCLVVLYEDVHEAKRERNLQTRWHKFSFIAPIRVPSSLAISKNRKRIRDSFIYRLHKK
jgi:hypothetical protein